MRWCNVVPFQAAGQGITISREDSAAQPGAERLQAAFRPRRNSQPSWADGVLLGSGPAPLPAFPIPGLADFFHQIDVLSGAIQINPAISFDLVRSRGDLAYSSRFSFLLRAARA